MLGLAAFADEISADLDEQIRVCRENGVSRFELRGVNGQNVMDFSPELRREIRSKLADAGMGVVSVGSPIGKVKISEPWPVHFERFKRAVEIAEFFSAPFLRVFSYYPPEKGQSMKPNREEVLRRFSAKVEFMRGHPVVLVHENEADIYGEGGDACLDLMRSIDSPSLRCAFDFANFVIAGERPIDNWAKLKPYTVHIHVKDARLKDKTIVAAGEGDGDIGPILKDAYQSGYRGYLSLEPHLSAAGQFSGFTGPAMFKVAADALKAVCRESGIPLALGTLADGR